MRHDPTDIFTLADVARYLKVHPMTVYKLVRRHRMPMIKVGGQWRIRFVTLSNWLDRRASRINGRPR